MRILVVGAGAIGGYFGARLAEAGRDVTFLVRPARAANLREHGLRLRSPLGDVAIAAPVLVGAADLRGPYDLVLVTCKAFDLPSVLSDIAPAVGPDTAILPLLNGMAHLDALEARFGSGAVLGGQVALPVTLADDGAVVHLNDMQTMSFGEREGRSSDRVRAIAAQFAGTKLNATVSADILRDMWSKWVFLASLAATTGLMRAPVGAIVAAPGGADFIRATIAEVHAIAAGEGFAPDEGAMEGVRNALTTPRSPLNASLMRDMDGGGRIEADHILGDLLARGRARMPSVRHPNLETAYLALKAYENRREAEKEPPQ